MKCQSNRFLFYFVAVGILVAVLFPDQLFGQGTIIIYIPIPWLQAPAPAPAPATTLATTLPTTVTPPPPVPTTSVDFQNSALSSLNVYRSIHSAPVLTASTTLQVQCQGCANGYAAADSLASPCRLVGSGEFGDVFTTCPTPRLAAFQLMNRWYNEVANVGSYTNLVNSSTYQHFTQMVWVSTTQFCCALSATTATRRCYASCIFTPAGNVNGAYAQNVLAPV